jgi:hypothetical protein
MSKKMQPGKIYRLRQRESLTFEHGHFLDFCFYGSDHSVILGHINPMGHFIGRVPVQTQNGNPHRMLGRIVDDVLECLDGRNFELIATN